MTLRLDEPFRWGGSARTPSIPVPHDGMATVAKAANGWQSYFSGDKPMLSAVSQTPAKRMREAQALYYSHPWIRRAETTVSAKVAGLPWHVEDENDDEVDDETVSPQLQAIRDLLEKPQANLPPEQRQPGITTRRGLVSITSRHMGLCGLAYWFLDQMDQNGAPLALIYVNPARMTPDATSSGNLIGWRLDADDYGRGGTPLRTDQVLPFYLEVPDWGSTVTGLVTAAALKARIVTASDLHALSVLGTGGRIAGLVSPKAGILNPDEFAQAERDFRNINESPDAAKRMTILRGPVDFTKTAADPSELGLRELSASGRDDIFATWGVPPSQAGVPQAAGLNSGEKGANEYEVLMTGPVHDRVVAIQETVQFDLLDRWHVQGISAQLVIEEPTFDDDGPAYELASKAVGQPLTNNERRAILKLDPLPDYGPDGEALGTAIILPAMVSTWAQGAEDGSDPNNPFPNAPKPAPKPVPATPVPLPQLGPGVSSPVPVAGKATVSGLRAAVDKRFIPTVQRAVGRFLDEQRADIVSRLRGATERQLRNESHWWRDGVWDKALDKALRPHIAAIARTVTVGTAQILAPGKAKKVAETDLEPFTAKVEQFVLSQTGIRIGGINDTTREAVGDIIRAGIAESLTASQIADRIEQLPAFDEARAELVARTESAFAYNAAAISSFREYGVEQVQAIDGDGDEECAARNGQVYSIDEASDIEDHPNGTLDWAPVFGAAA